MAHGHREAIGSILIAQILQRLPCEDLLQQVSHLLLGGSTFARYGLLNTAGRVLKYRIPRSDDGCYGHPLRTAKFQHALGVLAEKGGLYSDLPRAESTGEGLHRTVDFA